MSTGDTAWMLISSGLVFLMTPAVAFFYGGMVRAKATLHMMMLSIGAVAVVAVAWVAWGWSIAYGGRSVLGLFADPFSGAFLGGVIQLKDGVYTVAGLSDSGSYPVTADALFQMTFAVVAVALISGALAERVKFGTWLVFAFFWTLLCYAPLAHMVWGGGLLSEHGFLSQFFGVPAHDFAGGTVVHINAAVAALVLAMMVGRRHGFGTAAFTPHNVPFVLLGAFLLWFGWFGFNGGSAFGANGTAAYAILTTCLCACTATLGWLAVEKVKTGHATPVGAASGMVAGLVGITPSADVVSPLSAMVIGLFVGVVCYLAISVKYRLGVDDSLDVVGVHGVGGVLGTVCVGLFSASHGLFTTGDVRLTLLQMAVALVAMAYSAAMTWVIAILLEKTLGWRVSTYTEMTGIDLAQHGERSYDLTGTALHFETRVLKNQKG
ncbi:ammonium transporter [Alloscardovia macacae]|uniref:Ammonium transporter n=1 Tax=Alloscardovia macacae TaxID=1160091 RepID=A0A1Y2ST30_9BIFI|nr:ammonium transporter [Alloscardovia macacae]OTA25985.1 ammonium transporter [Alloscardovia macacae]OTA28752.1 ammonium transporter [Alloscardovia macacae]